MISIYVSAFVICLFQLGVSAGPPTPSENVLSISVTPIYANSSALLPQSTLGPTDGIFRRQTTTPKLLTQNMNNPSTVVSALNNTNNRAANSTGARANDNNRNPKTFTETVRISGGLVRTQASWIDGLKIDAISATPHTLSIKKKTNPAASAKFVTSADPSRNILGGEWRELTSFSYDVSFEGEYPDDLSFKISAPYDKLQAPITVGLDDEVYLGLYDPNRSGWVVDTERMENRRKDKRVDLIGIPAPTGEYRLLARSNRDPLGSMALSFGTGTDGQFNVLAPSGGLSSTPPLQVATWQDGSKIIIRSLQAMQIKMETSNTTTSAIPPGYEAATRYGFTITTNTPAAQVIMNLQLPYVPTQLEARGLFPQDLVTAGRPLRANQQYQILSATTISGNGALMNVPMNIVEGEYLLLARSN
ncbi:hypothetical protein PGT21_029716 [Puccinia graminis f. sp. tritici]|uniref:Uncharacterized protein n=1 Tax=Puccinia graminis f. sp. tritici TaxID=56615 RepID=A0A5B0LRA4_PUCGR|nr:hypothetical protein PGT21_029716 [Puccinia graminis f. sp. tritici]